jgi:hypothetical protein
MIGASAARDYSLSRLSGCSAAFDKLKGQRSIQPHPALRGIHCLGYTKAK